MGGNSTVDNLVYRRRRLIDAAAITAQESGTNSVDLPRAQNTDIKALTTTGGTEHAPENYLDALTAEGGTEHVPQDYLDSLVINGGSEVVPQTYTDSVTQNGVTEQDPENYLDSVTQEGATEHIPENYLDTVTANGATETQPKDYLASVTQSGAVESEPTDYLATVTQSGATEVVPTDYLATVTQSGAIEQRNLPQEYTELDYASAPATSACANTELTILPTYKVEFVFETGTLGNTLGNIFGGRREGSAAGNGIRLSKLANKGVAMYGFDSTDAYESGASILSNNTRYTFFYQNGVITLTDGSGTVADTHTYTPNDTEGTPHWAINGYYAAFVSANSDEIKFISLRIWDNNGALIAYYRAAERNSDSAIGAYDSVSNAIATPTSGTWTAGPDITPTPEAPMDIHCNNGVLKARHQSGLPLGYTRLSYLQSSGDQIIDTGYLLRDTDRVEVDYTLLPVSSNGDKFILGAQNNPGLGVGGVWISAWVNNALQYGNWYVRFGSSTSSTTTTSVAQQQGTLSLSKGQFVVNDTVVLTPDYVSMPIYPLTLFNRYASDGTLEGKGAVMQMSETRIFDGDNNLIHRYIAARRDSDNELGMYDLVSSTFLTNQGTGDFAAGPVIDLPYGYEPLDYIEVTNSNAGGAYIDTGVTRNGGDLTYEGEIELISTSGSERGGIAGATWSLSAYVALKCSNRTLDPGASYPLPAISLNTKYKIKFEYKTSEVVATLYDENGTQIGTVTRPQDSWTSSDTRTWLIGYARDITTSGWGFTMRYRRNKVYQGTTLAFEGLPARRTSDGALGMYDLVSNTFLTNAGTGSFTAGATIADPIIIYADGAPSSLTDADGHVATLENLFAVGTYADTQEVISGTLTHNIGAMILDGTEDWQLATSPTRFFLNLSAGTYSRAVKFTPYCTHCPGCESNDSSATTVGGVTDGVGFWYDSASTSFSQMYLRFGSISSITNTTRLSEFLAEQYAAGTPVVVFYLKETATAETVDGQLLTNAPLTTSADVTLPAAVTTTATWTTPDPGHPLPLKCNNGTLKLSPNLFDNSQALDDGSIWAPSGAIQPLAGYYGVNPIPVVGGKTYTRSGEHGTAHYFKLSDNTWTQTSDGSATITVPDNAVLWLFNNKTSTDRATFRVCEGNDLNTILYDGTQSTITDADGNVATIESLLAAGTYADTQEVIAGAITRNVGVKVFDGTETFTPSASGAMITVISDVATGAENVPLNTHFALETSPTSIAIGCQRFGASGTKIYSTNYYMKPEVGTTVDDFKAFLAEQYAKGNPVIVVYPLATATTASVSGQLLTNAPLTVSSEIMLPAPATTTATWTTPDPDHPLPLVCNNGELKAKRQSGLPLGYTLLDYLQSSGTQYIDTDYVPNSDTRIEADVYVPTTATFLFGSRSGTTGADQRRFGLYNTPSSTWNPQFGQNNYTGIPSGAGNEWVNIEMDKSGFYIDGTLEKEFNQETFTGEFNLYLFACNTADTTISYSSGVRFRNYRIYDNTTLVHDLLPAKRDSDNELGFYDLVSGAFLTNSGTGDFVAGNPVSDPIIVYTEGTSSITDANGNVATLENLLAAGTYADTQEVIAGTITRNVGVKVFDGSENNLLYNTTITGGILFTLSVSGGVTNSTCVQTHGTSNVSISTTGLNIYYGTENRMFFIAKYGECGTLSTATTSDNRTAFKAWLAAQYAAGNPVIVVYPLATPTTETVTGQMLASAPLTTTASVTLPAATTTTATWTTPDPYHPLPVVCNNGEVKLSPNAANLNVTLGLNVSNVNAATGEYDVKVSVSNMSSTVVSKLSTLCPNLVEGDVVYFHFTVSDNALFYSGSYGTGTRIVSDQPITLTASLLDASVRCGGGDSSTERIFHVAEFYCGKVEYSMLPHYVPCGLTYVDGTPETVTVTGKNLYNPDASATGKTLNDSGELVVLSDSDLCRYTDLIPVKPSTEYAFKMTRTAGAIFTRICSYDALGQFIALKYKNTDVIATTLTTTFTTEANAAYVRMSFKYNSTEVQLEEGDTQTAYESYHYYGTANTTDLFRVTDYLDTQEIISGLVTHRIGLKVLDGTESWGTSSGASNLYYTTITESSGDNAFIPMSSHYKGVSATTGFAAMNNGEFKHNSGGNTYYFRQTDCADIAAFKAFLTREYANGRPVIVLYALATATTENVDEQLRPYSGESFVATATGSVAPLTATPADSVHTVPTPECPLYLKCNNGTVLVSPNLVEFNETRIDSGTWAAANKTHGFEVCADVYGQSVGNALFTNANCFGVFVPCAVGESVSFDFFNYTPYYGRCLYCEVTADGKVNTTPQRYSGDTEITQKTFTLTQSTSIGFVIEWTVNAERTRNYTKENYMVVCGTTPPTEYIPYGIYTDDPEVLTTRGKNICDPEAFINGYYISATGVITSDANFHYSELIPAAPNVAYTFSGTGINGGNYRRVHAYNAAGEWIAQVAYVRVTSDSTRFVATGTTPANTAYLRLSGEINDTQMQLESGSTATAYRPYTRTTTKTATVENLYAVTTYKDMQEILTGLVTRKVGIYVCTGAADEVWVYDSPLTGMFNISAAITAAATQDRTTPCTHFKTQSALPPATENDRDGFCERSSEGRIGIGYAAASGNVATFKAFLAGEYAKGRPVVIMYPLATETTETVASQGLQYAPVFVDAALDVPVTTTFSLHTTPKPAQPLDIRCNNGIIVADGSNWTVDGHPQIITDADGNLATVASLLKAGDYADSEIITSGNVTRNVGVKVLTGTENWSYYAAQKIYYITTTGWCLAAQDCLIPCTHYQTVPYTGHSTLTTEDKVIFLSYTGTTWGGNKGTFAIRDLDYWNGTTHDVTGFKAYLAAQYAAGTPIIVVYPLATPTTETVAAQTIAKTPITSYTAMTTQPTQTVTTSAHTTPKPTQPLDIKCNNGVYAQEWVEV